MAGDQRRKRALATRAVHTGERPPRPDFTPTATPIYLTSSFSYDDAEKLDGVFGATQEGYVYARYGNPTTHALEQVIADLEGTDEAVMFASGMAAIHAAIISQVKQGDAVVAARDVYGATYSILMELLPKMGVTATLVDMRDLDQVADAIRRTSPRVVYFETVSNPLLRVANVAAITALAKTVEACVIVDNTFPTPLTCNPAAFGVDMVIHSTTKYFGGHGDVAGGAIATTSPLAADLRLQQRMLGAIISPFEAFLTLRGTKTMPLRFERQCANAAKIATWLTTHPRVGRVNYPGLQDLGDAAKQFTDSSRGAMLSFDVSAGDAATVARFFDALEIVVPATTLGDVFSLTLYPAQTSHRAIPQEARQAIGIGDGLVRLSAGIESADDIIADLDQALARA